MFHFTADLRSVMVLMSSKQSLLKPRADMFMSAIRSNMSAGTNSNQLFLCLIEHVNITATSAK